MNPLSKLYAIHYNYRYRITKKHSVSRKLGALSKHQNHDTILLLNIMIGGLLHMGLLQEWYVQETRASEEEKFHRPINDEQLFFHAVSSGVLTSCAKTAWKKNLAKRKALESCPVIR